MMTQLGIKPQSSVLVPSTLPLSCQLVMNSFLFYLLVTIIRKVETEYSV